MTEGGNSPELRGLAAEQVAALLEEVPDGSPLALDSSGELCNTLELLVPELLRRQHHEWKTESIDGFFFSSAVKISELSAELVGTCILISDQTVTPFALDMSLAGWHDFAALRIRLGEPGSGPLGISGPRCNSSAADKLLYALNTRLAFVDWAYDVSA
jgi:hypothetical protein